MICKECNTSTPQCSVGWYLCNKCTRILARKQADRIRDLESELADLKADMPNCGECIAEEKSIASDLEEENGRLKEKLAKKEAIIDECATTFDGKIDRGRP